MGRKEDDNYEDIERWLACFAAGETGLDSWQIAALQALYEGTLLELPNPAAERALAKRYWERKFEEWRFAEAINRGEVQSGAYRHSRRSTLTRREADILYHGAEIVYHSGGWANGPHPGVIHSDEVELAAASRSGRYPTALGRQDRKLGRSYQARPEDAARVSAWFLRHCVLALGRLLGLLDKARGSR